jgi:hypothetical protein
MPHPEQHTVYLKIRRSQKSAMLGGKPTFVLDARVELAPDDQNLVRKYGLGGTVVYDSKARKARNEEAAGNFQAASGGSAWQALKGVTAMALAALTLRVTVDGLMKGQQIACKELDELLAAEAAIVEACNNLKAYLGAAQTFDGRETLLEI